MTFNVKKLPLILSILGLALTGLGFAATMADPSYPTLAAPSSVLHGEEMLISTSSDAGALRIVIEDSLGHVIYDSDEDAGAQEKVDPDGSVWSLDVRYTVPDDATGPLTVTASDGLGRTATKTVTLL